jgi:hypothetical protein
VWGSWQEKTECRITNEQEEDCSVICAKLLETASKNDTFCSSIITGYETWCLQ